MSHAYLIDGIRALFYRPSKEVIASWGNDTNIIDTDSGMIRVRDTGGNKPALVMIPDGPCVIEHFQTLISKLVSDYRVICFDMPGFGFSYPSLKYDFGLEKSTHIIIAVLDALNIKRAILQASCANGHIAIRVGKIFPERVSRLVLAQTPSLDSMKNQWVDRTIPKPLTIPYLGQAVNMLISKQLSSKWYDFALPRDSHHKEAFEKKSSLALHSGACFCLASIVQGMKKKHDYVFEGLEIPTTMIWGNKDWSHKNTNFESIRDNVRVCNIIKFDGCGHFPNLEKPQEFASLLKEIQ